jgi:hypothetical protein
VATLGDAVSPLFSLGIAFSFRVSGAFAKYQKLETGFLLLEAFGKLRNPVSLSLAKKTAEHLPFRRTFQSVPGAGRP